MSVKEKESGDVSSDCGEFYFVDSVQKELTNYIVRDLLVFYALDQRVRGHFCVFVFQDERVHEF